MSTNTHCRALNNDGSFCHGISSYYGLCVTHCMEMDKTGTVRVAPPFIPEDPNLYAEIKVEKCSCGNPLTKVYEQPYGWIQRCSAQCFRETL